MTTTQEPAERAILALSGFMGVGKSSVGAALQAGTGAVLIDLDSAIEQRAGRSIPDIFKTEGEPAFRRLERELLAEHLAGEQPRILALGGGALVHPASRELALRRAFVVTLTARPATIAARCAGSDRPLLDVPDPGSAMADLLEQRRAAYADCHLELATDRSTPEALAQRLAARWRGHIRGR